MSYYSLELKCRKCEGPVTIKAVAANAEWSLGINLHCTPCNDTFSYSVDMEVLVAWCREKEGMLLT